MLTAEQFTKALKALIDHEDCSDDGNSPLDIYLDYASGTEICYSCNGTGKVWPSVEGEIVIMPGDVGKRTSDPDDGIIRALDGYRMILQPLKKKKRKIVEKLI